MAENEIKAAESKTEFEELSQEEPISLVREFFLFIVENKAWWMIPIILVLGLVSLFVLLTTTGAAPFIYTIY